MSKFNSTVAKVLLVLYLIFLHVVLILFTIEKYKLATADIAAVDSNTVPEQTRDAEVPTPLPVPPLTETATPVPVTPTETIQIPSGELPADRLMIPVKGVRRDQLLDTFSDARSEGRVHNAIDIMAAQGTPVVACADGEIAKFFDSERGGITIYQYSADQRRVYYYAHLERRSDQIAEKQFVKRGTVIGYVGDTGNSGAGNFHLHFAISDIEGPGKYWKGTDVNPYPLLKNGIEVN